MEIQQIIIYALGFVLGTALGSFINMLVYRTKKGESLLGRSYSDKTGEPLRSIDLIPIFSYLLFKGRSRTSGDKLPLLYPVVELLMGIIVLVVFVQKFNPLLSRSDFVLGLIISIVFMVLMVFYSSYDYLYWELEQRSITVGLLLAVSVNIIAIVVNVSRFDPLDNFQAAFLGLGFTYLLTLIFPKSGLSKLDISLVFISGAFLGLAGLFVASLIASFSGALLGLIKGFKKRNINGLLIQFAPLIGVGSVMSYLFRDEIIFFVYQLFS